MHRVICAAGRIIRRLHLSLCFYESLCEMHPA